MKTKITTLSIIMIAVFTVGSFAGGAQGEEQRTALPPGARPYSLDRQINYETTMLGTDVVGMTVTLSTNDRRIGKVTNVIYNLNDAYVPYIVCTFDGLEGVEPTEEVPIPLYMVSKITEGKQLQLLISDMDTLKNATSLEELQEYSSYGEEGIGWNRNLYTYWQNVGAASQTVMRNRIRELRDYRYRITGGRAFAPTIVVKQSELLNKTVRSKEGEELGAIMDFTINLETGAVHHLILFPDYSYTFEHRYYPIPINAFTLDTIDETIQLTIGSHTILQAPGFTQEWPRINTSEWFGQVEEYWSKTAFQVDLRKGMRVVPHNVVKASDLFGLSLSNYQQGSLGEVEDLLINRETDSLTYVMVEFGNALGFGGGRTLVPLGAMSISRILEMAYVNLDKEEIIAAPRAEEGKVPDTTGPGKWDETLRQYWTNLHLQADYDETEKTIETVSSVQTMARPQALPVTILKDFTIQDTKGNRLADINHIIVDLNTQKARYVVALIREEGIGKNAIARGKQIAVPFSSFLWDAPEKAFILGVPAEVLSQAPAYEQFPDITTPGWEDGIRGFWEEQIGRY